MGFLDAFRKGDATITLAVDPPSPSPGDEVTLRADVAGALDDRAQGLRLALRCTEHYLVWDKDPGDDHAEQEWRSATLHEEREELEAAPGAHTATFTLPAGLPHSSADAVRWRAEARIDRHRGRDAKAEQELHVPAPAAALPAGTLGAVVGEAGVGLEGLPAAVAPGATLEGVVVVTPPEDVRTTGVLVRLRRRRTYTATGHDLGNASLTVGGMTFGSGRSTIHKDEEVAELELQGGGELAAGHTVRLPFALPVPADAGPSVVAPHAVVRWQVEAVLARRMRGDHTAVAEVVVAGASAATPGG
ncbi:hypothetical protein [Conexibacter sp. SYSU D00693]|uniref:hypothetical protein n=1 Tax=Conexibacter sp. SYSU D00693 TaxID=2812560 RepID=UPI00196AEBBE|nr:hypothetical protein [Conexibacter sp. SYSU D00693]